MKLTVPFSTASKPTTSPAARAARTVSIIGDPPPTEADQKMRRPLAFASSCSPPGSRLTACLLALATSQPASSAARITAWPASPSDRASSTMSGFLAHRSAGLEVNKDAGQSTSRAFFGLRTSTPTTS